ncbi:hypothetical protein PCL1606_22440 [Pseudomonas chlororaphis]|uniref:Uncharacterized protein n=1 Tax=Pseudomonas chlororaphis TaxID=587753 RepID=A0A0D5XX91_9PSED|nr:hypothetical protein PCL1606_22440 [Pseudomonas chlororaphis]
MDGKLSERHGDVLIRYLFETLQRIGQKTAFFKRSFELSPGAGPLRIRPLGRVAAGAGGDRKHMGSGPPVLTSVARCCKVRAL